VVFSLLGAGQAFKTGCARGPPKSIPRLPKTTEHSPDRLVGSSDKN
jgi:hypothetical protein